MKRAVGIMHRLSQRFDKNAVLIPNFGGKGRVAIFQFERAPLAHRQAPDAIFAGSFELQIVDWLAVNQKPHSLSGKMLNHDTGRLRPGIVVRPGKQPADFGHLAREPVTVCPGSLRIAWWCKAAHSIRLQARCIGAGCRSEVCAHQGTAAAIDKPRNRAACWRDRKAFCP